MHYEYFSPIEFNTAAEASDFYDAFTERFVNSGYTLKIMIFEGKRTDILVIYRITGTASDEKFSQELDELINEHDPIFADSRINVVK